MLEQVLHTNKTTPPDCSDITFPELEVNLLPRRTAMDLDGAEGAMAVSRSVLMSTLMPDSKALVAEQGCGSVTKRSAVLQLGLETSQTRFQKFVIFKKNAFFIIV